MGNKRHVQSEEERKEKKKARLRKWRESKRNSEMSVSSSEGSLHHHHASDIASNADPPYHRVFPVTAVNSPIVPGSSVVAAYPSVSSVGATNVSYHHLQSAHDSVLPGTSYVVLPIQTSSFSAVSTVHNPILPGSSVSAAFPSTLSVAANHFSSQLGESAYGSLLAGTSYNAAVSTNAAISTAVRPLASSSATNIWCPPPVFYNASPPAASQSFQVHSPFTIPHSRFPTAHPIESLSSSRYRPILPAPVGYQASSFVPTQQNCLPLSVNQVSRPHVGKRSRVSERECGPTRKSRRLETESYPNPKFTYDEINKVQIFKFRAGECPPVPDNPEADRYNKFYMANDAISLNDVEVFSLGKFNQVCKPCKAIYFQFERNYSQNYTKCCMEGKIKLTLPRAPPQFMQNWINKSDRGMGKNFKEKIRNYNNMIALGSMGFQRANVPGTGPYCFKIHGEVYHRVGPLHPACDAGSEDSLRRYAQLYMVDAEIANKHRSGLKVNDGVDSAIVRKLDEMMRQINPYVRSLRMLKEVEEAEKENAEKEGRSPMEVILHLASEEELDPNKHNKKIYNRPTCNEVALVFCSDDGAPPSFKHIAIHPRNSTLRKLNPIDALIDPLMYPLFFPYGEKGWRPGIKYFGNSTTPGSLAAVPSSHAVGEGDGIGEVGAAVEVLDFVVTTDESSNRKGSRRGEVTFFEYWRYMLHPRERQVSIWLRGGKLTQQLLCGTFARLEANRLNWIRHNQTQLRVEKYQGLHDYLARSADRLACKVGKVFILPSSFLGSPRSLHQNYMDAMAIVAELGKPDYFITMTVNPNWEEIKDALLKNMAPWEAGVIIVRVFWQKVLYLIDLLTKKEVFGRHAAFVGTIEFQKRGLPHLHLLLSMQAR